MSIEKKIAAKLGMTEEQVEAVILAFEELDLTPEERRELVKAGREMQRIAKANGITLDELCRSASELTQ